MIIERSLSRFCVFVEDSVLTALQKISDNKSGVVFCVSENGRLEGVLTDGDIRRWLTQQPAQDLSQPVSGLANTGYAWAPADASPDRIAALFDKRIRFVPLLDAQRHLVAIAREGLSEISIEDRLLGADHPAFLIAEIGNNHNGSLDLAKRLIDLAVESGADCAKFQMRDMKTLYVNSGDPNDDAEDLGAQYTLDLLSRFNLEPGALCEALDHCRARGLIPMCTPWDLASVEVLESYGVAAYKVASADLTNDDLLRAIAETGKPILLSTGMSHESDIRHALALLRQRAAIVVPLHCNSTYPTPFKDVNLKFMDRLRDLSGVIVGYSGHERGYHVPVAAVARGAKVIEKHFTVDRDMEGNDHKVSLLPDEFAEMAVAIRQVEDALGTASPRAVTQGEMMNREILAKSLVAARDIPEGAEIRGDSIAVRSPGKGLQPNRRGDLLGRKARRALSAGEFFYPSDVGEGDAEPRAYRFERPWGIPVRYHDYRALTKRAGPDLLEFHLSYKDLEVDLARYFDAPLPQRLVVHAPELFANDSLLDLAAEDPARRDQSVANLQRVVEITRTLKTWFPASDRPPIIVNVGGFTHKQALASEARAALYDRLLEALGRVDVAGVELIPQTMPPFPWHFGGQQFHNLLVAPDEIDAFCRRWGGRVCFDVSHTALACAHLGMALDEATALIGSHTAHLHLADAQGVDGEGLQIGEGGVDFEALAATLRATAPSAGFIPEIWQGHKDGGAGFWYALDQLEPYF